jgi:peptide/nickel transport system permease protein
VHDQLGLDLPLWRQYFNYIGHALQGDFGISFFYQTGVWEVTIERLPTTLLLMGCSILVSVLLAAPFAVIAAVRRGGLVDQAIRLVFTAALGMPVFWSGIVLTVLLGGKLKLLLASVAGDADLDTLRHLLLASLTIALALSPIMVRTLRSSLIEVIGSDYVLTGTAMGLRRSTLLVSYLLRNSLRPVVSIISINIGYLIGGTVIAEQIFSLPGMGSLLFGSIATRDYAIIQLATLLFALLVVAVNLLADLLYSLLDPRISLAR